MTDVSVCYKVGTPLKSEDNMGAAALQVYTIDAFNVQCHASFAARRNVIAAGAANPRALISTAAAGCNA